MSVMCCNDCKKLYGPTLFQCPTCGGNNVERVTLEFKEADPETTTLVSDNLFSLLDESPDLLQAEQDKT